MKKPEGGAISKWRAGSLLTGAGGAEVDVVVAITRVCLVIERFENGA